jgi:hypothetical protein
VLRGQDYSTTEEAVTHKFSVMMKDDKLKKTLFQCHIALFLRLS